MGHRRPNRPVDGLAHGKQPPASSSSSSGVVTRDLIRCLAVPMCGSLSSTTAF